MTRVRGQGVRSAPIILAGDLAKTNEAMLAAQAAQVAAEAAMAQAIAARDVAITQAGNAGTSAIAAETARAAAVVAQNAAQNAQTAAEAARDAAQAAQTASETARDQSVTAKNASQAAQTAAETARNAAQAAQTAAEAARDAAVTAKNAAQAAQTAAEAARDTAVTAKNDAVTAKDAAVAAQTAAEAAAATVNPTNFYTKAAADTKFVDITGDSMSGGLTLHYPWPTIRIQKSTAAESNQLMGFSYDGNLRWLMRLGEGATDNFTLLRYNDVGTYVDTPFTINRATGYATFTSLVTAARLRTATYDMYDSTAGADLKTSAWTTGGGITALNIINDAYSTVLRSAMIVNHATGQTTFNTRPLFGANVPWDSANLPDPGWRTIAKFVATGSAATADFTIPAAAKAVRISGVAEIGGSSAALKARYSIDNGASFKSGASDYASAYFYQQGTSVAGITQVTADSVFITNGSDNANFAQVPVDATLSTGSATRVAYLMSTSPFYSLTLSGIIIFHSYANFFGLITNIRFFMSNGSNIPAGTVLTLEYLG